MKQIRRIGLFLFLVMAGCFRAGAQSELLQLNLLLEEDQHFEWTRVYPVWLAQDIPAQISVGKIRDENTLLGLIYVKGLEEELVLHGVISDQSMVMYEWYNDTYETGKVVLEETDDQVNGHWFNITGERRFLIESREESSPFLSKILQYKAGDNVFFTILEETSEQILIPFPFDENAWGERESAGKGCYYIKSGRQTDRYCPEGEVQLYDYYKVGLVHLIHGKVPQIPHDQIFNSYISDQLRQWENLLLKDSIEDIEDRRWSENQNVWFIPDLITEEVISGLLSTRSAGKKILHSVPVIYDKRQNKFYSTDDFFRTGAPWNKEFQVLARAVLYKKHKEIIDVFPEVFEQLRFHLTLTEQGLLISSDFTPYFGRLTHLLKDEGHKEQIQKFTPFRKLLNPR